MPTPVPVSTNAWTLDKLVTLLKMDRGEDVVLYGITLHVEFECIPIFFQYIL